MAWDTLIPILTQDNHLNDCQVLVNGLQVRLTLVPPTANMANQPPTIANLQPPLVGVARDEDLTKHREIILARDLPGRFQQVGTEAAIVQLTQALANGNQEMCEYRMLQEEVKDKEKMPSQCWPTTITLLMCSLNVADEANLPILWHTWAQAGKKHDL